MALKTGELLGYCPGCSLMIASYDFTKYNSICQRCSHELKKEELLTEPHKGHLSVKVDHKYHNVMEEINEQEEPHSEKEESEKEE